jgi:hypothetical protein
LSVGRGDFANAGDGKTWFITSFHQQSSQQISGSQLRRHG